jgi:hypothetical protein
MLSHNFNYRSVLNDALKINWRVEDLIGGERRLDFSRRFLPDALAGAGGIRCLSESEKLKLNQIRGFSYLHLFEVVEEFILPLALDHAQRSVGGDRDATRALLCFAEEEAKHTQLFRRFKEEFAAGFGSPCGGIGPASDIAAAVRKHSPLGVALVTLHLEWMTQKHYVESVKDNDAEGLDPQFSSLLLHHWMEESQHAKLDTMMVAELAAEAGPAGIAQGVEDYFAIGALLDGGLSAQVGLDLESLSRATGRPFTAAEAGEITAAQQRSYRWTFLGSGMTHPNFIKAMSELSASGHARLLEMGKALSA